MHAVAVHVSFAGVLFHRVACISVCVHNSDSTCEECLSLGVMTKLN